VWDTGDCVGAWRSLVARAVRVGEVPGSNPGAPIFLCAKAGEQQRTGERGVEMGFFFMPTLLKAQNGLEIHQNKKHGAGVGIEWAAPLKIQWACERKETARWGGA
jgi:hypothetical protein